MSNQAPAIETERLSRRFGTTVAVDDVSMTVERGEIFGFLGHNGAGKTTTIRLLNGLLLADSGQARILGMSVQQDGPAVRARTGVLTETPSLDERLTARLNLSIYGDLYGVPRDQVAQRVSDLLRLFELAERADDKVAGYSKGMKQRLALARALLHDPDVIFLDEPTAALDPVATRQVHELIRLLSRERGHTVFLCTHNLVEAQALCDRVGIMEHGKLVAIGKPDELAAQLGWVARLELELDPAHVRQTEAILAQWPHVTVEYQPNGNLLLGQVERKTIPQLLSELLAAGVAVYGASPQHASLSEVYFALHASEEARNR